MLRPSAAIWLGAFCCYCSASRCPNRPRPPRSAGRRDPGPPSAASCDARRRQPWESGTQPSIWRRLLFLPQLTRSIDLILVVLKDVPHVVLFGRASPWSILLPPKSRVIFDRFPLPKPVFHWKMSLKHPQPVVALPSTETYPLPCGQGWSSTRE